MLYHGTAVFRRCVLTSHRLAPAMRLATAIAMSFWAAAPAAAMPGSFGSPAVWSWFAGTSAQALQAVAPKNELEGGCATDTPCTRLHAVAPQQSLSTGGVHALNRTIGTGLSGLMALGPDWLNQINVGVRFREDLEAAYQLAAVQPLPLDLAGGAFEARGRFVYDPAGLTSGQIGLGYNGHGQDEPFALLVYTRVEENWVQDQQRYIFGSEVTWDDLRLQASLYNRVADHPGTGPALREAPIDGYQLDLNAPIPSLTWARLRASTFWHAALTEAGEPQIGSSIGLQLMPARPLVLETGTDDTNHTERQWFARLRLRLKFW